MYDTPLFWNYYFAITVLGDTPEITIKESGVVPADTYADVITCLAEYYGEENIVNVFIDAENDIENTSVLKRDGAIILFTSEIIDERGA